jgi:hypothetical protein
MHAFCAHEHARVLFEGAVGREGQPLVVHVEFGVGHSRCSFESANPFSLMGKLTGKRPGVTVLLSQKEGSLQ